VKQNFLGNIFLMLVANMLIKPIWILGIDRNIQLAVGDTHYGQYMALLNLSMVFSIVLDFGLTNYNNREVAKDYSKAATFFGNIIIVKFILLFIYSIALSIVAYAMGYTLQALQLLWLIVIMQFANSILQFLRSNISAHQHFKADTFISILDKTLMIIIFGILFLNKNGHAFITIKNFVLIQILCYGVSIICAYMLNKKYFSNYLFQFNKNEMQAVFKQSLPLALLVLLMTLYTRSDMFILERLAIDGAEASGKYQKCYRLLDAFNMIGFLFAGMLLPMFAKLISQQKPIGALLKMSTQILLPASFAIAFFSGFYCFDMMQLFYKSSSINLAIAFAITMANFPALCIMNIYSTALSAGVFLKQLIIVASIAAVLSIGFNCYAAKDWGFVAAPIIALGVQSFVAASYIYLTIKKFKLHFSWKLVLKYIAIAIVFFAINGVCNNVHLHYVFCILLNIIALSAIVFHKRNLMFLNAQE
jgi:O-antigen/teichoic acid export membrane protein